MALDLLKMGVAQMALSSHSHLKLLLLLLDPTFQFLMRKLDFYPTSVKRQTLSLVRLISMVMMPLRFSLMDKLLIRMVMSMLLVETGTTWMVGVIDVMPRLQIQSSILPIGR